MGETTLTERQFKSADINKDNIVSSQDYMAIKNMISKG